MSRLPCADHRDAFGGKRLGQPRGLNRPSHQRLTGADAKVARQRDDRPPAEQPRRVHQESGGGYGSPRVTAALRERGLRGNEKRAARGRRTFAITGARLRRRVRATIPNPDAPGSRTCSSETSPPRNPG